jgi:antitoxin FitA
MPARAIVFLMANLSVRGLDDQTYACLRVRAASNNQSMEEEARQILKMAVQAPERMGDRLVSYFGRNNGATLVIPARKPHKPVDLKF